MISSGEFTCYSLVLRLRGEEFLVYGFFGFDPIKLKERTATAECIFLGGSDSTIWIF